MPSEVDETMDPEETPDGYVRRVAQQKAEAVAPGVPGRPVFGADTVVVIDNQVLGKPARRGGRAKNAPAAVRAGACRDDRRLPPPRPRRIAPERR